MKNTSTTEDRLLTNFSLVPPRFHDLWRVSEISYTADRNDRWRFFVSLVTGI